MSTQKVVNLNTGYLPEGNHSVSIQEIQPAIIALKQRVSQLMDDAALAMSAIWALEEKAGIKK
jgi:hypothetical protein